VRAWQAAPGCARLMLPRGDLRAASAAGRYQVLAPPVRPAVLAVSEALARLAAWSRSALLLQVRAPAAPPPAAPAALRRAALR
jgi:hypothetical protein